MLKLYWDNGIEEITLADLCAELAAEINDPAVSAARVESRLMKELTPDAYIDLRGEKVIVSWY